MHWYPVALEGTSVGEDTVEWFVLVDQDFRGDTSSAPC
jgi:hypothetical protein